MVAHDTPKMYRKKRQPMQVPEYLVYEIIDGQPYYYKGYRDVLNATKTFEGIMGSSSLQWVIFEYLFRLLVTMPSYDNFRVAGGEPGLHLNHRNNLAGDILVFDKKDMPGTAISSKYADVPALLHIEIDISADLENEPDTVYLGKKISKLLEFGTKTIIWVFTKNRRVLVVKEASHWQWHNWDETLPLFNGVDFNIADYLKREGVEVAG
jgi:hypothetical protein